MAGKRVYVYLAVGMLMMVLVVGKTCAESGSGSESGDPCGNVLQPDCEAASPILSTILPATPSLEATLPSATAVMLSGTPPLSLPLTTTPIMSPSPTEDRVAGGSGEEGDGGGGGLGQGAVTGIVLGSLCVALLVLVVCLALGYWAREKRWRKGANKVG